MSSSDPKMKSLRNTNHESLSRNWSQNVSQWLEFSTEGLEKEKKLEDLSLTQHHLEMKFWTRKKGKRSLEHGSKLLEQLIIDCNGVSNPIRFFSSNQILKATNPYCPLSRDGYFTWYQGVIGDRPYAIKKFCEWDELGYNDMVLSARVSNHSGFLKLIGCCLKFRLPVLVFQNPEFGVLNKRGSVGSSEDSPLLPWNVRLKIAKEIAIAITYLHTAFPRIIIHRNIKAANVFLDKNWNAKLTDFSFSVTLPEGKTWIEDKVMGTLGYLEPTYAMTNLVTEYTDVYSFGIFMLVLLMGRQPVDGYEFNILDYAWDLRERGEPVEFGDDTNDMNPGQMKMFLELALRCCQDTNEDKPKMISVAKELKLIEKSLNFSDLETGSDTDESEEQEEPLATESQGAEQPLDLLTASSLNSQWNQSNRGFRILCFVFCFVFAMFIGNQLHTVTQF